MAATGQPQLITGCRYARFGRTAPAMLFLLFVLGALQLLTACTAPVRAPVSSREQPVRPLPKVQRPTHYRVQKGDTLYGISWRFGVEFRSLARWNGIREPYLIYAGQSLRLSPPPDSRKSRAKATTKKQKKTPAKPSSASSNSQRRKSGTSTGAAATKKRPTSRSLSTAKSPQKSRSTTPGKLNWRWPTKGKVQGSFSAANAARKGIQINGQGGQIVVAAEAGKVVYAGSGLIGYGRLIIVKHNKNYLSAYGHNRKLLVQEGDMVTRGQPLAEMGSNGTGESVLHFEIRKNGKPVDPLKLLPRHRL